MPGGGLSLDPFVGTRETAVFDAPRLLGSPDFVEPAKDFELKFSFFLGSPARSLSVFLSRRSGVETLTTSSDTDKDPKGGEFQLGTFVTTGARSSHSSASRIIHSVCDIPQTLRLRVRVLWAWDV